jgi:hypothetical protein
VPESGTPADPENRAMSLQDRTLKLVTNLDRAAVEAKLAELRSAAQAAGHAPLAQLLAGIEGRPRAEIERCVLKALGWLRDKPELKGYAEHLELIELNLPNLS